MDASVLDYTSSLDAAAAAVAARLANEIGAGLPEAVGKVWHGHPVWFLADNPVVGYSAGKQGVRLLFWSGQSFDEPGLRAEGKFKAAGVVYASEGEVDVAALGRWLAKARDIQWDYRNLARRKGRLERLA